MPMAPRTRYARSGISTSPTRSWATARSTSSTCPAGSPRSSTCGRSRRWPRLLRAAGLVLPADPVRPPRLGLSDPMPGAPTLEEQMDDVVAVMDAAGSERAAVFAQLEGGADGRAVRRHPSRADVARWSSTRRMPRMSWAPDYDWAPTREEREAYVRNELRRRGATGSRAGGSRRSRGDDQRLRDWYGALERLAASPGTVAHARADDRRGRRARRAARDPGAHARDAPRATTASSTSRHSRYLAEHIPGARLVELERRRDTCRSSATSDVLLDEIEEFLTGARTRPSPTGSSPR